MPCSPPTAQDQLPQTIPAQGIQFQGCRQLPLEELLLPTYLEVSSFVIHCLDTAAKGISGRDPDELHFVFGTLQFPVKFIQGNNMASGEGNISVTAMRVLQMQWKADTLSVQWKIIWISDAFWHNHCAPANAFTKIPPDRGIILHRLCYLWSHHNPWDRWCKRYKLQLHFMWVLVSDAHFPTVCAWKQSRKTCSLPTQKSG